MSKIIAQAPESLCGGGRGGAIDRFVIVVRIGRRVRVIAQVLEVGRARVPVGDSVRGGGLPDVVVGGCFGRSTHHCLNLAPRANLARSTQWGEFLIGHGLEKLELFGNSRDDAVEAAPPGSDW